MSLQRLSEVEAMPYGYLWFPYLIRENLNLIAGDGGTGKSYLSLAIAAAITTGMQPDGMPGQLEDGAGNVLFFTTEDDAPQIRNRFDKLGGDVARFFLPPKDRYADLADLSPIRDWVREASARLIVFDPVQSFLNGADMNKASDVRPMLDRLRDLCREEHCTAVLLAHSNKSEKMGKAQYRVAGTGDFVNGCRSALLVGFHPSEEGIRVAAHMKTNGEYGPSFRFAVEADGLRWMGEDSSTAEQIMNAPRIRRTSQRTESINPVVTLIIREVQAHGGAWEPTSTDMIEASRKYPDLKGLQTQRQIQIGQTITAELNKRGIKSSRINRNHPWYFNYE